LFIENIATIPKAALDTTSATEKVENSLYQMLKSPPSNGIVDVSKVVSFLSTVRLLTNNASLQRLSASDNKFLFLNLESKDKRLVNGNQGTDFKLIRGTSLTDAYATESSNVDASGKKSCVFRAIVANTYVKVTSLEEEQLVLTQIGKSMCSQRLLSVFVYNIQKNETVEHQVKKISDVICNFEKEVDPSLIAKAHASFVQTMESEKRFYSRNDCIPISSRKYTEVTAKSQKDALKIAKKVAEVLLTVFYYIYNN